MKQERVNQLHTAGAVAAVLLLFMHLVSSRGGKYGFVYPAQQDVYRALRRKGMSKSKAAAIANSQHGGGRAGSGGRKLRSKTNRTGR